MAYAATLLTASDCEGAGEMFRVTTLDLDNVPKNEDGTVDYTKDFFEKPVNLTVSGQLEAEAMAMAFGKVYTFGPTFRAEKSFTTRHAAEFWMIEPEMAFCDLKGYMDTAEAMTKFVIQNSAAWRVVKLFSARKVGPKVYTLPKAMAMASASSWPETVRLTGFSKKSWL